MKYDVYETTCYPHVGKYECLKEVKLMPFKAFRDRKNKYFIDPLIDNKNSCQAYFRKLFWNRN